MTAVPGWEDILDEGEDILWQGRPDGAVTLRPKNILLLVFGLFVAGFALFWMVMAAVSGSLFWMFGLIHFSVGVEIIAAAVYWSAFKRRRTWYTLTDRRAFIASDLPVIGKRLKSYPIGADTVLDFEEAPLATVNFAKETKRGKNGHSQVAVGFERIADGTKVYRIMRDIQAKARAGRATQRT